MAEKKPKTLEDFRALAQKELDRQLAKWTPEKIESRLASRVERELDSLVATVLGMENRWNKWEVDHCNGRAGESALGDYIRANAKEAVAAWMAKLNIAGLAPSKPMIAAAKKDYQERVKQALDAAVREAAHQKARELSAEFLGYRDVPEDD